MAKSTTKAYEVIIGTGADDSDSTIKVALINSVGQMSNYERPAQYGRPNSDNYERGSIEIGTGIPYTLDGDPKQVSIKFSGNKWHLGGIWVTNESTGQAWYAQPEKLITSEYSTFDLRSLNTEVSGQNTYRLFGGSIVTGNDGTDNKVSIVDHLAN